MKLLTPEYAKLARKKLDEYAESEPLSTWEREIILEFLPIWCEVIIPEAFEAGEEKYKIRNEYGIARPSANPDYDLNEFLKTIIQTDD